MKVDLAYASEITKSRRKEQEKTRMREGCGNIDAEYFADNTTKDSTATIIES